MVQNHRYYNSKRADGKKIQIPSYHDINVDKKQCTLSLL